MKTSLVTFFKQFDNSGINLLIWLFEISFLSIVRSSTFWGKQFLRKELAREPYKWIFAKESFFKDGILVSVRDSQRMWILWRSKSRFSL